MKPICFVTLGNICVAEIETFCKSRKLTLSHASDYYRSEEYTKFILECSRQREHIEIILSTIVEQLLTRIQNCNVFIYDWDPKMPNIQFGYAHSAMYKILTDRIAKTYNVEHVWYGITPTAFTGILSYIDKYGAIPIDVFILCFLDYGNPAPKQPTDTYTVNADMFTVYMTNWIVTARKNITKFIKKSILLDKSENDIKLEFLHYPMTTNIMVDLDNFDSETVLALLQDAVDDNDD